MLSVDFDILALNGGSSSIKFAVFNSSIAGLEQKLYGNIDRIGLSVTTLTYNDLAANQQETLSLSATDYLSAVNFLFDWLEQRQVFGTLGVIGHRVVHGMQHAEPVLITQALLDELKLTIPYDPEHLPNEIEMIITLQRRHPELTAIVAWTTQNSNRTASPASTNFSSNSRTRFIHHNVGRYAGRYG
jgi:acetate kinase